MPHVYLNQLSYALGSERASIEQSLAAGRITSDPAILKEAGFLWHHVSGAQENAYHLAKRAVEAMPGGPGRIDAVVYATCLPVNGSIGDPALFQETRDVKHLMDFPASHLQADFGWDQALIVGLVQQACTGLLGSLRLGRALLAGEEGVERVLCLTSDRFPEGALYEQAYNLISDGAAACVLSRAPAGFRLLAAHGITNGALARASDDETVGTYFNYTLRLIEETLKKAELGMPDIRWIVPQNMNVKAWQILSRVLKVEPERIYFGTLGEVAHVISGDNLINLKRLTDEGRIAPGDRVLTCMAGYGLNWQAVILERV